MFIWFKLKVDLPIMELFERMVAHNVTLVPGFGFLAEPPVRVMRRCRVCSLETWLLNVVHFCPCPQAGYESLEAARNAAPYLRATFSTGTPETMREGLRRLAEAIAEMARERGIEV
jgi:DNA-binding transcriptional MocR family regulator